jgi:DNA polymerase I
VNFGLSFGMKERGLAEYARSTFGVEMSLEEATRARAQFFTAYQGLTHWQQEQIQHASKDREVRTPAGRVRRFGPDEDWRIPTEALSHPVQGGAAECLLLALAGVALSLAGTSVVLVNSVHDEIICECDQTDVERVQELVEAKSGPNWAACK